jgi:hypothetical protein
MWELIIGGFAYYIAMCMIALIIGKLMGSI